MPERPGPIILFGSGETSASGQRILGWLLRRLPARVRGTIVETPAGFEPSLAQVAGRTGESRDHRL